MSTSISISITTPGDLAVKILSIGPLATDRFVCVSGPSIQFTFIPNATPELKRFAQRLLDACEDIEGAIATAGMPIEAVPAEEVR